MISLNNKEQLLSLLWLWLWLCVCVCVFIYLKVTSQSTFSKACQLMFLKNIYHFRKNWTAVISRGRREHQTDGGFPSESHTHLLEETVWNFFPFIHSEKDPLASVMVDVT